MKKLLVIVLALAMLVTLAACGTKDDPAKKSEGVMTYAEYAAAAIDSEVVIETYVQAKQGWWEKEGVGGVGTFYTQDAEGGYFLYDMPCSKADYDKLVKGTKIKVTGKKAEWSGEVEIIDATFVIEDGNYEASATDVTSLIGKDEIAAKMNMFISIKGATVEAVGQDAEGNDVAWFYKWNGAGSEGDDLYFKINVNGTSFTLLVESYLCGPDTDVYKAVKELKIGDKIDLEGFLYWYEGAQPHVTSVKAAG
ncbi:MAG: hypothetical protein J6U75_04330 [Clostridia bacterium]|nr:hypothetical protein [Clostridia bacterium]